MWSIRPFRPGDEVQLVALFAQVFGRALPAEVWRWKIKGYRPEGAPQVENVWVAEADDGRLIAQTAGLPARVKLAGRIYQAMISVDTMTAPDFRRQGILTGLGAAAYSHWSAAGVSTVLGLLNQQWGSRGQALGWRELFPLAWRRVPLRIDRLLASSHKVPSPLRRPAASVGGILALALHSWRQRRGRAGRAGVRVGPVNRAGTNFDELWERLSREYDNLLVRDSGWVNWRYLQAPGFGYRVLQADIGGTLQGYVAYRCAEAQDRRTGFVADLFTAPGARAVAHTLLCAALDDLWAEGAETARVTAPPGSPLDALLRSTGFRPATGAFDFRLVALDPELDVPSIRDTTRWLLTGGDFDAA